MKISPHQLATKIALVTATSAFALFAPAQSRAQCTELTSGLRLPLGTELTNQGNLLVAEAGTTERHSGRISIVDRAGQRRTLLDGLPSGIADVGEPSGPSGLFMRGRTLYLAIGGGDSVRKGPIPGTTIPNPEPISSPIYSSVLAIHFSAAAEHRTNGFTLTPADEQLLATGQTVILSSGHDRLTIKLIADFPNFLPAPLPFFAGNVKVSNPFDLVVAGNAIYVTDGGLNRVWQVDLHDQTVSTLVTFPNIPNPLFGVPGLPGGPFLDAVPTGISIFRNQLYVTLFRGAPFVPGTSTVEQIDPQSGSDTPFITGLKTAIDVLPVTERGRTEFLVLEHATSGLFFGSPGAVLRFTSPDSPPSIVANCLTRPTSMTLDQKKGVLYVTEYSGRLVAIPYP